MASKNLIYLVLSILVACILIFCTCYYYMNKNFDISFKQNLQIHANLIDSCIRDEKYRLFMEAGAISDSILTRKFFDEYTRESYDKLVRYIYQKYNINMLTIVDSDGYVLFGEKTLPEGYKVGVNLMKKALNGEATSDIVKFKKNGISICAASPIIIDNKLVGALMVGDSMQNNVFVDRIKRITNVDMTVFDNDTRISTTILQNGQRAVGTRLENYDHIVNIIDRYGVYNDDVGILGIQYKAIYWPLINNDGERLGLWFLGNNEKEARQSILYSSIICFTISGILSIIICFISIHFFNGAVNPLETKSITDKLTGVLNRNGIENLFNIAFRRYNGTGSFIIIDLDNFKDINDTLGHDVGDYVLRRTGNKLKSFFRNTDIVGRFGGDEFVVYAPDLRDYSMIKSKMRELVRLLRYGYNLGGNDTLFVTASIGIAMCPKDGCNYKSLFNNADSALYEIKASGRNGFGFYGEGRCY